MECTNEQLHYETLTIREAKNVVACLRKKVKEQDKIISSIQNAIEETKKFNKINRKNNCSSSYVSAEIRINKLMPSFVKDKVKLTTLQNFLDSIERAEKYFVEEAEKNIFDLRPNLSHPKSASISHIDCFIGGELNKSINKKSYLDPKQRQKRHAHWLINDKLEIKIIRF